MLEKNKINPSLEDLKIDKEFLNEYSGPDAAE
jgi:hypothetical protein